MSRYRFHIRDALGRIRDEEDEEGVELPDLTSALQVALESAREFHEDSSTPTDMEFEISDDTGETVLRVPIRDLSSSSRPVSRTRLRFAKHTR